MPKVPKRCKKCLKFPKDAKRCQKLPKIAKRCPKLHKVAKRCENLQKDDKVLAAVRTVVAFGGQEKEVATYAKLVEGAKMRWVQRGLLTGLTGGLSVGLMCAMYGLAFWYGIKCIVEDREGEVGWLI